MVKEYEKSRSAWPIFGIFLTLTAFAVSSNVIPPLITTIANEMKVDFSRFGWIVMVQFFSFFIAGILGGWACERFNFTGRALVVIGLLIVSATLLVGSLVKELSWFVIWAMPLGFGGGLAETFSTVLVSQHEKLKSSKLLNMSQVFFCMGAIGAPQVVALLLYFKIPWQVMFIIFGIFILLINFVFFLLTKNEKPASVNPVNIENGNLIPLLKDPMFFLLSAVILFYVTFESLMACWLAVYFEKVLFCPAHLAALRLSVFWGGLFLGRIAITVLPARFSLWPAMFTGVSIMCISSFLTYFTSSTIIATILVFLFGLGSGPLWPTTVGICHAARNRSKFTSCVIAIGAIGVVLGSGLGSVIFKYLGSSFFFPIIILGSLALLILSFLSYQMYYETHKKQND
jgi:fucose permease